MKLHIRLKKTTQIDIMFNISRFISMSLWPIGNRKYFTLCVHLCLVFKSEKKMFWTFTVKHIARFAGEDQILYLLAD